jgi:hypothetical protein
MGREIQAGVMAESTDPRRSESSAPGDRSDTDQPTMGELLRMFWLVWGNAGLLLTVGMICREPAWTFSALDAVFWGLVIALLAARFFDITRFRGVTASNEPANTGHWLRYALKLVLISALLWAGAQSVQI